MDRKILRWLISLNYAPTQINKIEGDASFRTFYRVQSKNKSYILMSLPPKVDTHDKFLHSTKILRKLNVPKIVEHNTHEGWLMVQDFGDITLNKYFEQNPTELEIYYKKAIENLITLQLTAVPKNIKVYDTAVLNYEVDLFVDWYLKKYKKVQIPPEFLHEWNKIKLSLLNSNINQAYTLVHRDYHSRNLMVIENMEIGIIDHQDILFGPITYDLVSLLKDVYIKLKKKTIETLLIYYYKIAKNEGLIHIPYDDFKKDFDLMGLQRHLKILGLFCRLSIRDSKHGYLDNLPLTKEYVLDVAKRYEKFSCLKELV